MQNKLFVAYIKIKKMKNEKSHTCEEGGDAPQNFLLVFIDEL